MTDDRRDVIEALASSSVSGFSEYFCYSASSSAGKMSPKQKSNGDGRRDVKVYVIGSSKRQQRMTS